MNIFISMLQAFMLVIVGIVAIFGEIIENIVDLLLWLPIWLMDMLVRQSFRRSIARRPDVVGPKPILSSRPFTAQKKGG